jgi:hypothetical protein
VLLRHSLVPYIYTEARVTYDSGVSICHPLYYDYPESADAYNANAAGEYAFGENFIVAPVTTALDAASQLAKRSIWIPEGDWIEWPTGVTLRGPKLMDRSFRLDEIPVYARAGAIVPTQQGEPSETASGDASSSVTHADVPPDPVVLQIFPGATGEGNLYEDAGDTLGYKTSEFAWTHFHQQRLQDGTLQIQIMPAGGGFAGMPAARSYELRLNSSWPAASITVNGVAIPFNGPEAPNKGKPAAGWRYDGETTTTIINLPEFFVSTTIDVRVAFLAHTAEDDRLLDGAPGRFARLHGAMHMMENTWPQGWAPDNLMEAAQTGRRMTIQPKSAPEELRKLEKAWPEILKTIDTLDVPRAARDNALAHLKN